MLDETRQIALICQAFKLTDSHLSIKHQLPGQRRLHSSGHQREFWALLRLRERSPAPPAAFHATAIVHGSEHAKC